MLGLTEGKILLALGYTHYFQLYNRHLSHVAILAEQHDTKKT
jgi:hypothetical protein